MFDTDVGINEEKPNYIIDLGDRQLRSHINKIMLQSDFTLINFRLAFCLRVLTTTREWFFTNSAD